MVQDVGKKKDRLPKKIALPTETEKQRGMERKTAVLTGATGGIGKIVCQHLVKSGYTVYAACRDARKGEQLLNTLDPSFREHIVFVPVDLMSLYSVKEFCNSILEKLEGDKIEILLNNAGMIASKYETTEDGYESSMQVNYLAAKLITETLLPHITGKVINTVSCTIATGNYCEPQAHDSKIVKKQSTLKSLKQYSNTKFMLAHYTIGLHRRVGDRIGVYGADPGIVNTSIISMKRWYDPIADLFFRPFIKTPEQGAIPLINAITHTPEKNNNIKNYPLLFVQEKIGKFPRKLTSLF